jgi:hypothetical protein
MNNLLEALNGSTTGAALVEDTKVYRFCVIEPGELDGYDVKFGIPGMPPDTITHYDTLEQVQAALCDIPWLAGADWLPIEEEDGD